jgi:hypothetical protein
MGQRGRAARSTSPGPGQSGKAEPTESRPPELDPFVPSDAVTSGARARGMSDVGGRGGVADEAIVVVSLESTSVRALSGSCLRFGGSRSGSSAVSTIERADERGATALRGAGGFVAATSVAGCLAERIARAPASSLAAVCASSETQSASNPPPAGDSGGGALRGRASHEPAASAV